MCSCESGETVPFNGVMVRYDGRWWAVRENEPTALPVLMIVSEWVTDWWAQTCEPKSIQSGKKESNGAGGCLKIETEGKEKRHKQQMKYNSILTRPYILNMFQKIKSTCIKPSPLTMGCYIKKLSNAWVILTQLLGQSSQCDHQQTGLGILHKWLTSLLVWTW